MIKNYNWVWLVIIVMMIGCQTQSVKHEISITYENNKPVAVFIPFPDSVDQSSSDVFASILEIHVGENEQAVIGDRTIDPYGITFKPIIPFSSGLTYKVTFAEQTIGQFTPVSNEIYPEAKVKIYPQTITLPENILKMHLYFDQPMREDGPLNHILVIRQPADTINNVFLDLDPPLWDAEGKILTLWVDPGRVKRDLIPNRQLGAPFSEGDRISVIIYDSFETREGSHLKEGWRVNFLIGAADRAKPAIAQWKTVIPRASSNDPLIVNFNEVLDDLLLQNSFDIMIADNEIVEGSYSIGENGERISFTPSEAWQPGTYQIRVKSTLEDLAGNNLNRLFDVDLANTDEQNLKDYYWIPFSILESR